MYYYYYYYYFDNNQVYYSSVDPSSPVLCSQHAGLEGKVPAVLLLDKVSEKSPTKARQPRKVDLRARYWAFLFDNLRRAVDEIYVTCESDQSVVECKVGVSYLCNEK